MPNQTRRPAWAFVFAAMLVALIVGVFYAVLVLADAPNLALIIAAVLIGALFCGGE